MAAKSVSRFNTVKDALSVKVEIRRFRSQSLALPPFRGEATEDKTYVGGVRYEQASLRVTGWR